MNISSVFDIRRNQFPDAREIPFFDNNGALLFSIPDKSFIHLLCENGDHTYAFCQWIDDEHIEINGQKFSKYKFTEQMERSGISYASA